MLNVELHADAFSTYKYNLLDKNNSSHTWPNWIEKRAWDAANLLEQHGKELLKLRGTVDLIAGGPPCQGFSINGLRRPDDPRSQMVDVYLKYVEIIQPRLVLLENVAGFHSMKHRTGGTYSSYVVKKLNDLGYDVWFEILKASDWGVPQKRPRFILVAALKGFIPGINPIQRLHTLREKFLQKRDLDTNFTSTKDAISDLEESDNNLPLDLNWGHLGFKTLTRKKIAKSKYQELMRRNSDSQPTDMRLPRHSKNSTQRMQLILDSCEPGICLRPADRARLGIKKRSTTPLNSNAPAPTIGTLPDDFIHYSRPRSMSVREHARLQSFPDWFTFYGPYTTGGQRRKDACPKFTQVGNAVPPLLAEALGEMLLSVLDTSRSNNTVNFSDKANMTRKCSSNIRKIMDTDFITTF